MNFFAQQSEGNAGTKKRLGYKRQQRAMRRQKS
jgi:hypothetical protein